MAEEGTVVHDYKPHQETYGVFIKLTIATILACGFVLVGLMAVAFADSFALLVGGGGIAVGLICVAITLMTGGRNWLPATGLWVLYFLLTVTLV